MDWYSWLSKTNLEPTFVYEYGLVLARHELREEDLTYFNHDFLQSIGISVAKHRLEILKLAKKEVKSKLSGFSRLVWAMNNTKKIFTKNIGKFTKTSQMKVDKPNVDRWIGRQRNPINGEKTMFTSRSYIMRSGPLDQRTQEKLMMTGRSVSVSGPLDSKLLMYQNWTPTAMKPKDRLGILCQSPNITDRLGLRSPKVSCDDGEVQSLWSLMFQDMKPT